jgi:hypothetical protein
VGIAFGDRGAGGFPSAARPLGLQLPPVRENPQLVDAADQISRRCVVNGSDLRGDNLEQKFQAIAASRPEQSREHFSLVSPHVRGIARMTEAKNLHDVVERPLLKSSNVRTELGLQSERPRPWPFDRASDPQACSARRIKRVPTKTQVAQDPVAGTTASNLQGGGETKLLESPDLLGRRPVHLLQLHAVIEREDLDMRPVAVPIG